VLEGIDLARVNDRVLSGAAALEPAELRTLDAIHLATARRFGSELGQLITYDARMIAAAARLGMRTVAPT
jgi:predicted nucleic acid-binding protein